MSDVAVMSDVALYVGGPLDGQRRAVPVHHKYFTHPVHYNPIPGYREECYIQTGIRSSDDHVRVYIYEPLLLENPSRHATEVAFGMLIEGYRSPRCV